MDLDRPDFSLCKTPEDFIEIKCALMEKIIDIELQIDLFKAGLNGNEDASWLPRATAAVKWAKLYRDECQSRAGRLNDKLRGADRARKEARFVDAARDLLTPKMFYKVAETAGLYEDPDFRVAS